MEKFNLHRFGLVLRQNVTHQSKHLLMTSLGCVLLHLAAQSFSFFQYIHSAHITSATTERMAMEQSSVFFLIISVFYMFWCIALSCYHLKDKPGCITALMLPATVQEKFAARLLIFTLGAFVVNLLAIVAADLLRILLFSLQSNHYGTALPALVDFCGKVWSQFWHDVDEGDLRYGGGIFMFLPIAKALGSTLSSSWVPQSSAAGPLSPRCASSWHFPPPPPCCSRANTWHMPMRPTSGAQ